MCIYNIEPTTSFAWQQPTYHKAPNVAMEESTIIRSIGTERQKIEGCSWSSIAKDLEFDITNRGVHCYRHGTELEGAEATVLQNRSDNVGRNRCHVKAHYKRIMATASPLLFDHGAPLAFLHRRRKKNAPERRAVFSGEGQTLLEAQPARASNHPGAARHTVLSGSVPTKGCYPRSHKK